VAERAATALFCRRGTRLAHIFAWGRNTEGQCGFPRGTNPVEFPHGRRNTIVDVVFSPSSILQTCKAHAPPTAGEDVIDVPTAVAEPASRIRDVASLAAGRAHTVAVTKNGEVHTFGCPKSGKLGRDRNRFEELSKEASKTARTSSARKKKTENTEDSRLADGTLAATPARVRAVSAAASDHHTLILDGVSGNVLGCGENKEFQLGLGTRFLDVAEQYRAALRAKETERFLAELRETNPSAAVAAGSFFAATPASARGLHGDFQWCANAASGMDASSGPVFGGNRVRSVAAGRYGGAAADEKGKIWTWGGGFSGELGVRAASWRANPTEVDETALLDALQREGGAVSVSMGGGFTVAVTESGGLVVWGRPPRGCFDGTRAGQGTGTFRWSPPKRNQTSLSASSSRGNMRVACGFSHFVATDGTRVWASGVIAGWEFGEAGGTPEEIVGFREIAENENGLADVFAGDTGACGVLTGDGGAYVFGAPVGYTGGEALPALEPSVPNRVFVTVPGEGGEGRSRARRAYPGVHGVFASAFALGGAHAVLAVEGL
jgi:alpha-tubulin suppressor-like RCC1 family protein